MPISPTKPTECAPILVAMPISPSPPSSPSKRRRNLSQSHYNDHNTLEASPSKRRVKDLESSTKTKIQGTVLFGKETTNNAQGFGKANDVFKDSNSEDEEQEGDEDEEEADDGNLDLGDWSMQSPPKIKIQPIKLKMKPVVARGSKGLKISYTRAGRTGKVMA